MRESLDKANKEMEQAQRAALHDIGDAGNRVEREQRHLAGGKRAVQAAERDCAQSVEMRGILTTDIMFYHDHFVAQMLAYDRCTACNTDARKTGRRRECFRAGGYARTNKARQLLVNLSSFSSLDPETKACPRFALRGPGRH